MIYYHRQTNRKMTKTTSKFSKIFTMAGPITTSTKSIRMKRLTEGEGLPRKLRMARNNKKERSAIYICRTNGDQHLAERKAQLPGTAGNHQPVHHQTSSIVANGTLNDQDGEVYPLQIKNYRDATTMSAWLDEWDDAPNDPLPSNVQPLWLLTEPAAFDLRSHRRLSRTVSLVHYHPTMVPEGRAAQDQAKAEQQFEARWRNEQEEGFYKHAIKRWRDRQEVVAASQHVEVINLTSDHVTERRPLAPLPYAPNLPAQLELDPELEMFLPSQACLEKPAHPGSPSCFTSQQHPPARSIKTRAAPVAWSWQQQLGHHAAPMAADEHVAADSGAMFHYFNNNRRR